MDTTPTGHRGASARAALDRIAAHPFHPLDPQDPTFTIDRDLGVRGVADPASRDGVVRSLALRDLVAACEDDLDGVAAGLDHPDLHVRCVSATALGIAAATATHQAVARLLSDDAEPLVRSHAAIALGEMGATPALPLLQARQAHEAHPDVRHQLELAIAQIEAGGHSSDAQRRAYRSLRATAFARPVIGEPAPDLALDDTEGRAWSLAEGRGQWQLLIWIFADWCPVCHREFAELMDMRAAFEALGVRVATLETHDTWRGRLMVGREIQPALWGSRSWFREAYTQRIWWRHLLDRAGAAGARYGTDPATFAVHGEYVNRPTTAIVDPGGILRFAYAGSYWGDRPSIEQTLDMIRDRDFTFAHPKRLSPPR